MYLPNIFFSFNNIIVYLYSPFHYQVAQSSNKFGKAYEDCVDSGMEMAGVTKDTETRTQIVHSLKSVSMTSSKLLMTTKPYMADPNAPNSKNLLTQAARQVGGGGGLDIVTVILYCEV